MSICIDFLSWLDDSVYWLKLSPDNKMVLVLAGSGTIMGFRLPSMRLVFKKPCLDPSGTLSAITTIITSVVGGMSASCTISKNNKTIYLISKNSIHVYDLMQRKTVKVYEGVSNGILLLMLTEKLIPWQRPDSQPSPFWR